MKRITCAAAALTLILAAHASAQWIKTTDPTLPKTRDGKPDLAARTPRASDGKPDLSGVWAAQLDPGALPKGTQTVESITGFQAPRHFVDVTTDLKPEDVQLQPGAADLFRQNQQSGGKADPITRCLPTGVPALTAIPLPYKIIQTPKLILILYEEGSVFRQIFLDNRRPVPDAQARFMGYSTGKWEGDTLVVDTVGFNDKTWLDRRGHPHSDALHLTERFRRRDVGNLEIETTIDDPKTYAKPFKYTVNAKLVPGEDLLEYFCAENEKDVQHFQ